MKELSTVRASHVNSGTGFKREELKVEKPWARQFRHPKLTVSVEESDSTAYGGLALATALSASLRIPQRIDEKLDLLRIHLPYHESDHVLTHVYNLFIGGECSEDIANLQLSEPIRRMLGTRRIPDPTTAGDFLRRFGQGAIDDLNDVCDELHKEVWRRTHGRKKSPMLTIDLDSHVHPIYGNQKEGADYTYKGTYGFHPFVITIPETHECLRIVNRSGNVTSADGAAAEVEKVFPMLTGLAKRILVRGDSAFASQELYDACERHGHYFAFVSPKHGNFDALAMRIPEEAWTPFESGQPTTPLRKQRARREDLRRKKARARKKRDLKLLKQDIAEIPYQPARSAKSYRLIIRRQQIEEATTQGQLFIVWRYRYVITNLPESYTAEEAVRLTYKRCDQENVIEQLQHGIAAMRMPTGDFLANSAFLVCARIAHNFKAWLALLALPRETLRWHWKRFRQAFVTISARVVRSARQVLVRFSDSHRFARSVVDALRRLQT